MLSQILQRKHVVIGIDGTIYRTIPDYQYRLLRLTTIIFLSFVAYILKHITYIPVTVIGHTVYAKVIAAAIGRRGISYKLCKTNNRIIMYETSNGDLVQFEGPINMTSSEQLPVLTCKNEELTILEDHTGLNCLDIAQKTVLQDMDRISGVHMTSLDDIIGDINYDNNISNIEKITNNLFYITSCNKIWLTSLILTDVVEPLEPGDIITGFAVTQKMEQLQTLINCESEQNNITVETTDGVVTMERKSLYYVEDDLSITNYSRNLSESSLYNLRDPRPFIVSDLCTIHPFHLPTTWDPLLAIMIVTTSIVTAIL